MEQQADVQEQQEQEDANNADRNVTIEALRKSTRNYLSALLNPDNMVRLTDKNLPRNWLGLAQLCNIKGDYFTTLENDIDPTEKLLKLWFEQDPDNSTIDKLILFLNELNRRALINKILPYIDEDIKFFKKNPFKPQPINLYDEKNILTNDDAIRYNQGLPPQIYDAFVLFADDDIDFATELIDTMEKQYHMKFCAKDRNLIRRGIETSVIIKLITERCKRLIIILSDAFIKSTANNFFLLFTQSYGIVQGQNKIIPCLYKQLTTLPSELTGYFMLDYRQSNRYWSFWDCLFRSIDSPTTTENIDEATSLYRSRSENYAKHSNNNLLMKQKQLQQQQELEARPINHVKFNSFSSLEDVNMNTPLNNENHTCDNNKTTKSKKTWFKKFIKKSHKKVALES